MKQLTACCGLDCESCEARIATIANDDELREKTARKWSAMNNAPEITASTINCMGCRTDGVKFAYCSDYCQIRKCAHEKGFGTCGDCKELDNCTTVGAIFQHSPGAKENLKAFAALDDASIDVTTEANKKTIITVDSEGTYSAVLTRTDDSIKVTVSSGSDAARSAVISNIDMTAKTATLEYKGTSAALAFTADKATLAKDGSIVTLEYKDHQYILTMDNALASEFYDAVKDVSLIKLPATFEEVNDNIAIEEVEKTVLVAFDFDEDAVDGKITGTNAVATVNGNGVSIEKTDKLLGTGALKLENSSYLDVKKTDGKPVVSGQKAITISYYSKTDAGSGWAYFISKDDQSPVYQKEYYLGILDKPEINVERYANGRVNEANTGSRNGSEWTRIDVVYAETSTELYVNGVLEDTKPASTSIEDSIGTNSIFHIGQATWGSGEYFTGMIDNFTVYGSALSSNEIQALYKADTAK